MKIDELILEAKQRRSIQYPFKKFLEDYLQKVRKLQDRKGGRVDLDDELDGEFRMAISHMQLGYENNMPLDEFDKMIGICVNIAKTYMQKEHKCAGCDTIIYYKSYCDNCQRLWES